MKMQTKSAKRGGTLLTRRVVILFAAVVLAVAGVTYYAVQQEDSTIKRIRQLKKNPGEVNFTRDSFKGYLKDMPTLSFDQMVERYRQLYGENILRPNFQYKFIGEAVTHCQENSMTNYVDCVESFIRVTFPDVSSELIAMFEKFYSYNEWMKKMEKSLSQMDSATRADVLWNKRNEMFGDDDAKGIFSREAIGRDLKRVFNEMEAMKGATLDEKLEKFKNGINDIKESYPTAKERMTPRETATMTENFLGIAAVQDDLSRLGPDERRAALRGIREGLGMERAAIDGMERLDAQRDKEWDTGAGYMRERAEIEQQQAGPAREAKLAELRVKYFGVEGARIIEAEERSGYHKFKDKRVYGGN